MTKRKEVRMTGAAPIPPSLPPVPPPIPVERSRENLRFVAAKQKGVLLALLLYFVVLAGVFLVPPRLKPVLQLACGAAGITAAVFVFMLAIRLYGTAGGVILGILTLIPVISLIVLLVVNAKATGLLKANGVHVGFLGADLKKI